MNLRFFRNVRLGIKSLLLHKLRSLLTMLGVVFGVSSVVAMLAVGQGANQQALDQIRKLGATNIIVDAVKPESQRQQQSNQQAALTLSYGLTYDDASRIRKTYSTITQTAPAKIAQKTARFGESSRDVRVVGTTPDWFDLVDRQVLAGRVLTELDQEQRAAVCVITENLARKMMGGHAVLGQMMLVDNQAYEIVGVVASESSTSGNVQTPDRPNDIYIPLRTAKERIGDMLVQRTGGTLSREHIELHKIICRVGGREHVEPTADAIRRMLENNHDQADYSMSVPLTLLRQAQQTQRMFNIVLGSIAGISLLVGGIGIMNIMLASVTERTREIGVRRAIGARQSQIIGQFLIETMVLSVIGGLIGVGLGVTIPFFIEQFADMPTDVTGWAIALSLGISASVGIIFGLYPAYRAAALDPIQALRHE
jgi:putative ABC transport system permease protein